MTSNLMTRKRSGPFRWENSCGNMSKDESLHSAKVKLQLSRQQCGSPEALGHLSSAPLRRVGRRITEPLAGIKVDETYCFGMIEWKAAHTSNLCKRCCNERRLKRAEEEVGVSCKVEGVGRVEGFSRDAVGSIWHGTILSQNVRSFHHQKSLGQIGLGRCRKCQAKWNRLQVAKRDAVQGVGRACEAHGLTLRRCADAPSILCGEVRRLGSGLEEFLGKGKLSK